MLQLRLWLLLDLQLHGSYDNPKEVARVDFFAETDDFDWDGEAASATGERSSSREEQFRDKT